MAEHDQFMALLHQSFALRHHAESLSTFAPVIVTFAPDGYETRWAPTLIPDDQRQFVEISTLVLLALKRQDQESAGNSTRS